MNADRTSAADREVSMDTTKIPMEGTGVYWFIDTATAKNLPAARLRMREFRALGFTDVWIAEFGT